MRRHLGKQRRMFRGQRWSRRVSNPGKQLSSRPRRRNLMVRRSSRLRRMKQPRSRRGLWRSQRWSEQRGGREDPGVRGVEAVLEVEPSNVHAGRFGVPGGNLRELPGPLGTTTGLVLRPLPRLVAKSRTLLAAEGRDRSVGAQRRRDGVTRPRSDRALPGSGQGLHVRLCGSAETAAIQITQTTRSA